MFGRRDPDARGYFGAYGGRFVPETLVAPIEELTAGYLAARADAGVSRRARSAAHALRRASDAALRGDAGWPRRAARRRADLPEARGPDPHRRAQDQQRARPGAARPAHGQDAASSPRPAPASTAWPPPPPARCSASSASSTWAPRTCAARRSTSSACSCSARRCARWTPGSRTLKDAINEAMRDWVANVHRHLLPARLGARAASVPADGARVPVGDRPRGAAADARAGRPAARRRRRLRRRRQQRHRHLRRLHRRSRRAADRRRGGRRDDRARTACRALRRRQHRRAAGHAHVRPAGRGRQHRADALDLRRARLRRGRPRARLAARAGPHRIRLRRPTPRRSRASRRWRGCEGIIPALESAHAIAYTHATGARRCRTGTIILVNLSGRGDKDVQSVAEALR